MSRMGLAGFFVLGFAFRAESRVGLGLDLGLSFGGSLFSGMFWFR